jgi:DNA-binding transcriptional MerR regulator
MLAVAYDVDRDRFPYKMKDLCERTGLPRQVIHFYIQQGLVPEGHKTGRNMAYYGDEHVERVLLVRKLQHERFLPLKAIRALLEERDEVFSPAQQQQLRDVRTHLSPSLRPSAENPATIEVDELLARLDLQHDDVEGMVEAGILATAMSDAGKTLISRDDAWILEMWSEVRRAGFTRELGFSSRDLSIYEQAISRMFQGEAQLLATRLEGIAPEQAAQMVERVLPLIHAFLARFHIARTRSFLSTL